MLGHADTVLALDTDSSGTRLITSSKDRTIRIWDLTPMLSGGDATCIGVGTGHTGAVGSCALARKNDSNFAFSGGEDKTIKKWLIPEASKSTATLKSKLTIKAHDKTINCIAVSANDKLLATSSQDKLIKVFTLC